MFIINKVPTLLCMHYIWFASVLGDFYVNTAPPSLNSFNQHTINKVMNQIKY